jgi:hypothetical protein
VTDPEPPTGNDTGKGPPCVRTEPEASVEDDVGETDDPETLRLSINLAVKKEMLYLTRLGIYSSWTATGFVIVSTLSAFCLFLLNVRKPGGFMGPPPPPNPDYLVLLRAIEIQLQGLQMHVLIDRDRAREIAPNRNPAAVNVAVGRPIIPVDGAFAQRRCRRSPRLLQLERERARVRRGRLLFDV